MLFRETERRHLECSMTSDERCLVQIWFDFTDLTKILRKKIHLTSRCVNVVSIIECGGNCDHLVRRSCVLHRWPMHSESSFVRWWIKISCAYAIRIYETLHKRAISVIYRVYNTRLMLMRKTEPSFIPAWRFSHF